MFWKARGEQRSRLQLASELTLIYIPLTAGSQLTYELPFLLGHPFNLWTPTTDPGWRWLWWQYGLADTRYRSDDPWIFGLEFAAVLVGVVLTISWLRLLRKGLPDESRIKSLWLVFSGITVLLTGTVVYYVTEIRAGFNDIGQGAYGLWFKLVGENVPYMILPVFVLYAVYLQVDYLSRRAGATGTHGRICQHRNRFRDIRARVMRQSAATARTKFAVNASHVVSMSGTSITAAADSAGRPSMCSSIGPISC